MTLSIPLSLNVRAITKPAWTVLECRRTIEVPSTRISSWPSAKLLGTCDIPVLGTPCPSKSALVRSTACSCGMEQLCYTQVDLKAKMPFLTSHVSSILAVKPGLQFHATASRVRSLMPWRWQASQPVPSHRRGQNAVMGR